MGARVTQTAWGPWPALRLEDEAMAVTVVPQVGGRVVSLADVRTGREWLVQGEPPDAAELERWAGEDARFVGRESFGWDECLPTVTVCPDPTDPSAPPLRDHGDQWGRPCDVRVDPATASVTTRWPSPRWPLTLERRLTLSAGAGLVADYLLRSRATRPLPVLWSAHPVLHLEPGTRIGLGGVPVVRVVGVMGWSFEPGEAVGWPEPVAGFDLSRVRAIEERGAVKLYAATTTASATTPDGARITVRADGDLVRTTGVWLDAGGWPPGDAPVHQTALEPTSSPDDHVAAALAHGRAWALPAGGSRSWWIRVQLDEVGRG
jgi:hypothetical protein